MGSVPFFIIAAASDLTVRQVRSVLGFVPFFIIMPGYAENTSFNVTQADVFEYLTMTHTSITLYSIALCPKASSMDHSEYDLNQFILITTVKLYLISSENDSQLFVKCCICFVCRPLRNIEDTGRTGLFLAIMAELLFTETAFSHFHSVFAAKAC